MTIAGKQKVLSGRTEVSYPDQPGGKDGDQLDGDENIHPCQNVTSKKAAFCHGDINSK